MHYYPIIKDSSGGGQATSGHKRIRCRGVEADPSSKKISTVHENINRGLNRF